jgi:adenylate cyclase
VTSTLLVGVNTSEIERKLAAIFAADVQGYSRLMGIDEVGTLRTLTAYREIIDALIAQDRGRIFNTAGDSITAEFPSVVDAVQCAVEVQRAVGEENGKRSPEQQMHFRIGVHVGDVLVKGDNLFGDGVNIAARLEALAEPGGICVSGSVRDYVGKKLPVVFTDCGEQAVKNIAEPVRAYRINTVKAAEDRPSLPLPDKPSIAVLPFTNISGDPEQEYFADGMVEEIITALSRVKWFFVIARNSSFTFKGRAVDIKQVGRELGVRYVLEGSVRKAGNQVRITGQLIDATTCRHVWADRFEGGIEDVFDLQDRITESVVGVIEPNVLLAEIGRAKAKPTGILDAYDLYLRSLPFRYSGTREGTEEAMGLLLRAIAIDPQYAVATAGAALCHCVCVLQRWEERGSEGAIEGVRLAREALAANPEDTPTLSQAGYALSYLAHDHDAGLAAIDRALQANPNSAESLHWSGWIRCYIGAPHSAIEHFRRAIRLSPLDANIPWIDHGLSFAYLMLGEYGEALSWATKAVALMPAWEASHRGVVASLALLGRLDEARAAACRLRDIAPTLRLGAVGRASAYPAWFLERYLGALRQAGIPE